MLARVEEDHWAALLDVSKRIDWRIEDVLGEDASFDFGRPFLPNALTGVNEATMLDANARRTLGHIRAHGYLGLFGVVEEMILPFVLSQVKAASTASLAPARAYLQFAAEEAKHIALFRRFRAVFERGFGRPCALIGPADEFARAVLEHPPLSVALAILHIEWMTQRHWLESVRGDESLEPSFKSLLRHHWLEEAQHARLDALAARDIAGALSTNELDESIEGYLAIVRLLEAALTAQVELDLETLARATGRALQPKDAAALRALQQRSMFDTFIRAGATHPQFLSTVKAISPEAERRILMLTSNQKNAPVTPSAHAAALPPLQILNGLEPATLTATLAAIAADPSLGPVAFRAKTSWQGRFQSQTLIASYDLAGKTIERRHTIRSDEPSELFGTNSAPNPQDLLLAALNACMMVGFVVAATARGVRIDTLEVESSADFDLRGAFGIDPSIAPGATRIRYTILVKGDASAEEFEQIHREMSATSPNRFHLTSPLVLEPRLVVG
ncbi:MAG TPA: OsmC family protein [Polyangiaceae bacterium]